METPELGSAAYAPMPAAAPARHAAYINYDVFASPQSAYGEFAYGLRVGAGVAQVGALARAFGDAGPRITLLGAAWQRHSDVTGSTLTIGDSESYRGKYEEAVRFDGIQYSSRNTSYALGWERTDFPDSPIHFGGLMTQLVASKDLGRRVTGEAHFFADSTMTLIGVGATWRTPSMGTLRLGIAPYGGRGATGFFSYALTSPRLRIHVDDRVWTAQPLMAGALTPPNYRQWRLTAEYDASGADTLRLAYGSQSQGGLSIRTTTLGFAQHVGGAELHVDLAQSAAGTLHNLGLATYVSVPLSPGASLTEQRSLQGGSSSNRFTLKQNAPESGIGTGYTVDIGRDGTAFADASFLAGTPGSTTQLELSRFGGETSWGAEFSGALTFVNGRTLGTNQKIDQSSAFDILKGRSAATLTIVTDTGHAVASGALVRIIGENSAWRTDDDGRVEIDDVATGPQTLIVTLPSGTCVIGVTIPPALSGRSQLGKQMCRRM